MKKIILFIIIMMIGINIYSQTSKAILKTYFETGDKPTQEQFWEFIDNSYNQGTDGILEYTGNSLNIDFSPYTSKSDSGILYTGTDIPTDTTTFLNYNGTFRAAKIKIGNIEIDPEGVGTTYSSGSGIYVDNVNDQIDWVGTLDTDADIEMSTNRIYFYTPSGGRFEFDDDYMILQQPSSKIITISSSGGSSIYGATGVQISGTSTGDVNIKTSTNAASDIIITDQKTTKTGIVYAADYSSDIISNNLSLINVGMTLDLINDTAIDVRSDLSDSCAVLRSLIGGSGIWTQSGNKIYPISSNDSLGIGGVPTDKFYVNGNITASNITLGTNMNAYRSITTFCNSEYFGVYGKIDFFDNNASISNYYTDLRFYDENAGTKTLSQLANITTSASGLTTTSDVHRLGGPLAQNTTISGSYEMNFTNSTFSATPISSLELSSDANVVLEYGYDSVSIENGSIGNHGPHITDLKTVPEGLKYFEEYDLASNKLSIPYVGMEWDTIFVGNTKISRNNAYPAYLQFYNTTNDRGFYWNLGSFASGLFDMSIPSGLLFHDDHTAIIYDNDYLYWEGSNILRTSTDTAAWLSDVRSMAGGGDVSISGTPADNQIAVWTDASTIEGNSTFTFSENSDTLIIDNLYKIYRNTTSGHLIFAYQNTPYFSVGNASYWGYVNTNGAMIGNFARSNTLPSYTWEGDNNTGIGSPSDDRLYLQAGGDKLIEIAIDSVIANDTIYLDYLGVGSEGAWLYLTPDNAIDTGTLADAGFGLTMDIPETMTEFMNDNYNDELPYFYKDANGVIQKTYTLKGGWANQAFQKIGSRVEITMRYVRELEKKNNELESRIERLEKLLLNSVGDQGILPENIDEILEQSKQETDEILNLY
jgi:hypothetical protein